MIGVVGTSRGGLVENRTAKERVAEALSFTLSQIQIQADDVPTMKNSRKGDGCKLIDRSCD